VIGFLVWGHHLFTAGQSAYGSAVFSGLSFLVAIPSAIKVFNWTATLYKGSISFDTPMLYALGFIWLFTIGGLTGLFVASLAFDVHVHDTYFVIAHFHYIMVGASVMAYLGAIHFWWPKISGRMYPEGWGDLGRDHFLWIQPDFLPTVHPWIYGNASQVPFLPGGVPGPERDVDCRILHPGSWVHPSTDLFIMVYAKCPCGRK
jgi:heme/copper-type cytochrome/quinol oxidase subunit 1